MNKRIEEILERIKESKKNKVAGNMIAVQEKDIDILINKYLKQEEIKITRKWEMPNSKTFKINSIKETIKQYVKENDIVIDPFANEHSIKKEIKCKEYISNDIDKKFNTDYHLEAQDFLKKFKDNSIDVVLFDPPYSGRQVKECYNKLGKTVTMNDTNAGYFTKFKKEIARVLKPKGICITCCWNTNGIGKKYGFEIVEILDIAHGSSHNDTLVTVESKEEKNG